MLDSRVGRTAQSYSDRRGWFLGGAIGGFTGAIGFGVLIWLIDPEIVSQAIPAIFGLERGGSIGWVLHLVHGTLLGLVFSYIMTRPIVQEMVFIDVETDILKRLKPSHRIISAGIAYGLAVWAVLPLVVLPVWSGLVGTAEADAFPRIAPESLLAHLIFGVILGIVVALTTRR